MTKTESFVWGFNSFSANTRSDLLILLANRIMNNRKILRMNDSSDFAFLDMGCALTFQI